MDHIYGSVLPPDIGNIKGMLENSPVLVPNAVRGNALQLDGVNQAVNLGNQRHRCLGKEQRMDLPARQLHGTNFAIVRDCASEL